MSTVAQKPASSSTCTLVIGASMAGLLAGRVLTDHFEQVILLDRDQFPLGPEPRTGVPQGHHGHIYLKRGQMILENLFPGILNELVEAGAAEVEMEGDMAWRNGAGWAIRRRGNLSLLSCSRAFLEHHVRRRALALSNLEVRPQAEVTGLLANENGQRARGVQVRWRGEKLENDSRPDQLEADLIVDASGRSSDVLSWLEALGYPPCPETVINPFMGYSTRICQPPENSFDWKILYLQFSPPDQKRSGLILPIEGGRWLVALLGANADYPPDEEAEFLEYAKSLPSPVLAEAYQQATPLTPIRAYRPTANRRRHFDRMKRWPEGFVVLGDAACTFNPVYGQGMTIASLGAEALGQCLATGKSTHYFQRMLAKTTDVAWLLSSGPDLRFPETEGEKPGWFLKLQYRYLDQIFQLTTRDNFVKSRFVQIVHLVKSPQSLFTPGMLWRVLWNSLFHSQREPADEFQSLVLSR